MARGSVVDMDPAMIARGLAGGRVGFGVVLTATPLRLTRTWLGRDAERPGAQILARSLGARDLALGVGTLAADRDHLERWLLGGLIADVSDLVATLATPSLPPRGRILGSLAAGAGVTLGLAAVGALRRG
jgi:hypothetical protein